jgi:hypothetical protein
VSAPDDEALQDFPAPRIDDQALAARGARVDIGEID